MVGGRQFSWLSEYIFLVSIENLKMNAVFNNALHSAAQTTHLHAAVQSATLCASTWKNQVFRLQNVKRLNTLCP